LSLSDENRRLQKPPGKAPPQDVNHPPPAEMKYTEEAGVLFPNSAARWRARGNHLSKIIFYAVTKKNNAGKR
jgi:hypothetical protein